MCGFVGLASVTAQATTTQSAQQTAQPKPIPATNVPLSNTQMVENTSVKRGERMVCKEETILGTRLKGIRACRTADEWRRISRGFQARLKETNDRAGAAFSGN